VESRQQGLNGEKGNGRKSRGNGGIYVREVGKSRGGIKTAGKKTGEEKGRCTKPRKTKSETKTTRKKGDRGIEFGREVDVLP